MKSRYASPLGVRVPQERLTDLRISLMPSGLQTSITDLYHSSFCPVLGRVELTCESSVT